MHALNEEKKTDEWCSIRENIWDTGVELRNARGVRITNTTSVNNIGTYRHLRRFKYKS